MPQHLRTRGHPGLDRLQYELHVEAGLFGNRKTLGDACYLDRTHQIVDQLVDRARPHVTEMPDRRADRSEERPRPFEIGGLRTYQKRQLAACRRVRQTGYRTIDIDEAASTEFARQIERMRIGDGRAFYRKR